MNLHREYNKWISQKNYQSPDQIIRGIDLLYSNLSLPNPDPLININIIKNIHALIQDKSFNKTIDNVIVLNLKKLHPSLLSPIKLLNAKTIFIGGKKVQAESNNPITKIPIKILPNNKLFTLNTDNTLLIKNNIDLQALIENNGGTLSKNAVYVMKKSDFENVSDFLRNLSLYKSLNEAFNHSNLITLGKPFYASDISTERNKLLQKSKKLFLSQQKISAAQEKNQKKYTLQVMNASKNSEYPDWLTAKAYSNVYKAVEANNQLKSAFSKTRIITPENKELAPNTINKINSHNQLSKDIKDTIISGLLSGDSVLLKAREGVDYSINTKTQKPFENIQQIYLQQLRMNNNFTNPYFMPLKTIRETGFDIPPKNMAVALSSINKLKQEVEFTYYLNGDQIKATDKTLDVSRNLINTNLSVPFTKSQNHSDPKSIKPYTPKSISISENFAQHVSRYFKSIYTGEYYEPPQYTPKEILQLVNYISHENSSFFKDILKAHKTIKDNLAQENINHRQHAKVRHL